jgi:hypothetical protein
MPVDPPIPTAPSPPPDLLRVGVLSDTHGYLHPQIASALQGVHRIIHTGDIESPEILTALAQMAPLSPIRGNMDFGDWAAALPTEDFIEMGNILIYALHDLTRITLDPEAAGIRVILSGHTHQPQARWQGDRLYLNPGSASLPRHGLAPSVAILEINGARIAYRIIELAPL